MLLSRRLERMVSLVRPVLLALSFAAVMATSPAVAQSKLDFTLLNRTGLVIKELYVSPANVDAWGEDILGRDVLPHDESLDVSFSRSAKSCMWDMRIVDEDDDAIEWGNLDFCKAAHITIMYENGKPTAIVE